MKQFIKTSSILQLTTTNFFLFFFFPLKKKLNSVFIYISLYANTQSVALVLNALKPFGEWEFISESSGISSIFSPFPDQPWLLDYCMQTPKRDFLEK